MGKAELDNLVRARHLKVEAGSQPEIDGLIRSGSLRLHDAANESLNVESRLLDALLRVRTQVAKRVQDLGPLKDRSQ